MTEKYDCLENFSSFYKYLKVLGKGSFGKVVKAVDLFSNQVCAVKVISKKQLNQEEIQNIRNEAQVLSQLQHPNVIKFLHLRESESCIFLAMEYAKAGTLQKLMERKRFSENKARKVMQGLLSAVEYLHTNGIAHRDIKPENILVVDIKSLWVKLADFGLCVELHSYSQVIELCGTIIYMAPEQAKRQMYSKEVDLWACGTILYMLLSTQHPLFCKTDTAEVYIKKLTNPKWEFPNSFPDLAKNLFLRLCKLKPIERYSAKQALVHPWVLNQNTPVPLTYIEQKRLFDDYLKLRSVLYSVLFCSLVMKKH